MNKQQIATLKQDFDQHTYQLDDSGIEFCYARDLMILLGYERWENFSKVVEKAKKACENSGVPVHDHFRDITKMVYKPYLIKQETKDEYK